MKGGRRTGNGPLVDRCEAPSFCQSRPFGMTAVVSLTGAVDDRSTMWQASSTPARRCCQSRRGRIQQQVQGNAADFPHGNVDSRQRRIVKSCLRQVVHAHHRHIVGYAVTGVGHPHHGADRETVASSQHRGEIKPARGDPLLQRLARQFRQPVVHLDHEILDIADPMRHQRVAPTLEATFDGTSAAPHQEQDALMPQLDQVLSPHVRGGSVAGRNAG